MNNLLETNLYTQNIEISISVALTTKTEIEIYLTVYDAWQCSVAMSTQE